MKKKQVVIRTIIIFISSLALALQGFPVFSQQPVNSIDFLQHNKWTIDDGLPMNSVLAITQTPDGYIWAGTETGLARFDGVKFETFNHENTPAFSSNIIVTLLVDHGGTLWITTRGGGVVRYKNGLFEAITANPELLNCEAWCIMESTDNSIWIGSRSGLCHITGEKLSRIPLPASLSTHVVAKLLEDRNGHIWVGTKGDGLVLVEKRGHGFESETIGLKGMEITALFEDRKGAVWVGALGKGLFRFWGDRQTSFTTKNGLSNNTIGCFFEDRFGNLWIGTNDGINILPAKDTDRFLAFEDREEFGSRIIYSFYQDRENTLWIGTGGGGLSSLRETQITTYTVKNGLSYNIVYGVFQDSNGRVWVGTKGYGINYFKDNRFYTLTMRDGLSSNSVVTMAEDPAGNLWFGTLGSGINRFKNGHVRSFTLPQGLPNNTFRAIYVDPEGNVLAGTVEGKIFQFLKGTFTPVANVKFRINTFLRDSRGNFWAGTLGNGFCRVNLKDGSFETLNHSSGLSNNIVSCIHEDEVNKGVLWIGTAKGLNRFRDGTFRSLFKKDGLPDDTTYWVLEDHKHNFWISSNRGIYCLCRKEAEAFFNGDVQMVHPTVFGKEAGMRSIECNGGNQPSGWRTLDGKLWFPTTHGVSVIDPKNIGINKIPPPLVIEKMIIDGKIYPANKEGTVEIPAGKNNLELHYTALSFVVPKKICFKYKMEGYEEKWVDAQNNRTAYYTDLPPGRYRFRVAACNCDGVWNNSGAWVRFHLKAKFYQTLTFKILLLLVIVSFILLFYLYLKKNAYHRRLRSKTKSRDRSSTLSPEEINEYVRKLLYLIEVEKLYKDPNLSIKALASRLIITSRNLSQIINDELKMNFHDFIAEYRIKEAQRILRDAKTRDQSIIDIAYEVGYNSKSAFNRAFKNVTHMTPSQFRKKYKK